MNHKVERINRNKNVFRAEEEREIIVRDIAFKEIRACRDLEIKECRYLCPICGREFNKRHGLLTHITMAHPSEKWQLKGKK